MRRHLPADVKKTRYNLRPRAHEYVLLEKDNRSFIISRFLYRHIYCKNKWRQLSADACRVDWGQNIIIH